MDIKLKNATINNIKYANFLLTKLIMDEKKYDDNINENCVVTSLYENFINDDNIFLCFAEIDCNIVGYIYGFLQNNGDAYKESITQLDAMYVEDSFRKMGIGNALIDEFIKWSKKKKAKFIELKVCIDNNDAISLYHKNYFKEVKSIMRLDIEGDLK